MPDRRPNILCFVTDQHRADHLACYGNRQVLTPNIDGIARDGVVFTQSYVANPVCMPNRATMFTGRYPSAHGLTENGYTLDPSQPVLPGILRDAGYQTASAGKIHLSPFQMTPEHAAHDYELFESRRYWDEGGSLPIPYYGLEKVSLVCGHGPWTWGDYKQWLDNRDPALYQMLKTQNAFTPPTGARDSWKSAIPEEFHYNTYVADRTIDFLETRDPGRPFFAWCSFPDPHHPFSPPRPYCDMYDPADIDFRPARRDGELDDLPHYFTQAHRGEIGTGGTHGNISDVTDDHYREIHALTYGMISMVDANVGRVMDALGRLGLAENTVVVFFSDHGDLMGDHWLINKGPFLYSGLARVPTIWRVPGGMRGSVTEEMISTVDLMPTLLDLAGVPVPENCQGRSYAGVLAGDESAGDRGHVYIEYDESYIGDRLRQIRTREWALTCHTGRADGLLFDLAHDPLELHNVWDRPDLQDTRHSLLSLLPKPGPGSDAPPPPKPIHA